MSMVPNPRDELTRSLLPRLLAQGGARVLNVLASPRGPILLEQVWRSVNQHASPRQEPNAFNPRAIEIHPARLGRYPGVILELPPPDSSGGVRAVAMILEVDLDSQPPPTLEQVEQARTHYATLEEPFSHSSESSPSRFVLIEGGEQLELASDPDLGSDWCRLAKTVADWLRGPR